MKRATAKSLLGLLVAVQMNGCAQAAPTPAAAPVPAASAPPLRASVAPSDPPIAIVNGEPIPREEVVAPLLQASGLNFLLLTVQMKVARQEAAKQGIVVKPEDIEAERNITMKGLFPESGPKDYDTLTDQLLLKQGITKPQYDLIIETNAALRKIAEPQIAGKVTEENIKQAFDLKYGTKVEIRDIKLPNIGAAQVARQRLASGEKFDAVVRMSTDDETRPNGGLWPPFGAATQGISQAIKDEAWKLKDGEISDVISTEGSFHIIQLVRRIAPPAKIVQLDATIRESLLKELNDRYLQEAIKLLRVRISQIVGQPGVLDIRDPGLKKQFDEQLATAKRQAAEQQKQNLPGMINRLKPATQPATQP